MRSKYSIKTLFVTIKNIQIIKNEIVSWIDIEFRNKNT